MAQNRLELHFPAYPENIALGRIAVVAFLAPLDPLMSEVEDAKLAVSELVTNCIQHAYPQEPGPVHITLTLKERTLEVTVADEGVGCDVGSIASPDRSTLGLTLVRECTDEFRFTSSPGKGTTASFKKTFSEVQKSTDSSN